MDIVASSTSKRFRSLFDTVAADQVGSLGDDLSAPSAPGMTMLGPSVGDDGVKCPFTTSLGPSVGDDT
jgi:hypothetical protein